LKDETIEERIEDDNVEINITENNYKEGICFSEMDNKIVIKIPATAKKEDLFALKDFLSQEKN
jgi:hypothetical protein